MNNVRWCHYFKKNASVSAYTQQKNTIITKVTVGIILATTSLLVQASNKITCLADPQDSNIAFCDGNVLNIPNDSHILEISGKPNSNTPHHLTVTNVTLNPVTLAGLPWTSTISLGGNNGSQGSVPEDYGALTLIVANSTIVTDTKAINGSGLYVRTDTQDALTTLISSAQITTIGTSGRTESILLESFHGDADLYLKADNHPSKTNSKITVTASSGTGAGVRVTADLHGKIRTDTGTSILTQGNDLFGITAGGGMNVGLEINNSGDISTNGNRSNAINAIINGAIKMTNDGQLITDGSYAHAIYALNNANTAIYNHSIIISNGEQAAGIRIDKKTEAEDGDILINTSATSYIESNGKYAEAIHANIGNESYNSSISSRGNIEILAAGSLKTTGETIAEGIYGAITKGDASSGNISITFIGDTIETTGSGINRGIYTLQKGSGEVNINHFGRLIQTAGSDANGIYALSDNNSNGSTSVKVTGNIITQGANANAIWAQLFGGGGLSLISQNNQITTQGDTASAINVNIDSTVSKDINIQQRTGYLKTSGKNAHGIEVNTKADNGNINVNLLHTKISTTNEGSQGIHIQQTNTETSNTHINVETHYGKIDVLNSQSVVSASAGFGIRAHQAGQAAGNINIINNGTDITIGRADYSNNIGSTGIDAQFSAASSGDITINNAGNLSIFGQNGTGVNAVNQGEGKVNLANSGKITLTDGSGLRAIARSGDVKVNAANTMTVKQQTASIPHYAIEASSADGEVAVYYDNGTIKVSGNNSIGISAQNNATANSIHLGSHAMLDATEAASALQLRTNGRGQIWIDKGARIHGGTYTGIHIFSDTVTPAQHRISNYGYMDAISDLLIDANAQGGSHDLTNGGTMVGNMRFINSDVTMNNLPDGHWLLRQFSVNNNDGKRGLLGVAITDFGKGNNRLINQGVISLAQVNTITDVDVTGSYVPNGALNLNRQGVVQGQLLNLNRFEHSGVIDLRANNQAGNVLVISGSHTAGVNGRGSFISNGGAIYLNSVMNHGDESSISDVLVLDNVVAGVGPTAIYVDTVGGSGQLTQGDGIKIINVLGSQSDNAFTLGDNLTYGLYEYHLVKGRRSDTQNDWFLRNNINNKAVLNPEMGSYLGSQYIAATMFNHNLLDRRDSAHTTNQMVWLRNNFTQQKTEIFTGLQKLDMRTNIFQLGADLMETEDVIAGVFASYGDSKVRNKSQQSDNGSLGEVKGYNVGAYISLLPQQAQGFYADIWGAYAWYHSKLISTSGKTSHRSYHSNGYALSAESGYGLPFYQSQQNTWWLEPHLQMIYSNIDADDTRDSHATQYTNNDSSGFQTRVGFRVYAQPGHQATGVTPFFETNWLHNAIKNKIDVNSHRVKAKIGRDVAEVKLGVQGRISSGLNVWGHLGGQRGNNHYKNYQIQLGLGWHW